LKKIQRQTCCTIILLLISLLPSVTNAEIYRWTDENGKTHFSDKKVGGVEQSKVTVETTKGDWKKFKIDIRAVGFELTAGEKADIENGVIQVYQFFDKKLYFDIYKTVPVDVTIFAEKEAYIRHVEPKYPDGHNTRGIYFPKSNEIVVYIQKKRDSTFRTIRHEVSHAIIDTLTPFVPAWLNEGIAENMEVIAKQGKRLYLKPHTENYKSLVYASKTQRLIGMSEFLSLTSVEWRKRSKAPNHRFQTQAGEFVRFLLSSPSNRSFLTRLIHTYKRGARTLASDIAADHYIGGLFTMESKWISWKNRKQNNSIWF